MLNRIWLAPPLAFARIGPSRTPSAAFMWSANELTPKGTAQTTLTLAETIDLDDNGAPHRVKIDRIIFRDEEGVRPVCPYFELHGEWIENGEKQSGPITQAVLRKNNIKPADVVWDVHVAQLKAFHFTYDRDNLIEAAIRIRGDDTHRHTLEGRSPVRSREPLVPKGKFVPLGAVQVAQSTFNFPEIRLRFYAPAGYVYGPTNLDQRITKADFTLPSNRQWGKLRIPADRKFLNPRSSWARLVLEKSKLGPFPGTDTRTFPDSMFAFLLEGGDGDEDEAEHHGLGLIDDISDGLITCTIEMKREKLSAIARVVVSPPDFAPANRPPISVADVITDRIDRDAVRNGKWTLDELRDVVCDIFERAFETSDLINKDYQNLQCREYNRTAFENLGKTSPFDREDVEALLWSSIKKNIDAVREGKAAPLHLSEAGHRKHHRYAAIEYLEMRFREDPELFEQWIRRPLDPNPYFDTRMPALMRGSDTRPWHLTRRQWELVRLWIDKLR